MTLPGPHLRRRSGGFTLLELMIAIGIFSLVAAIAYTGLHSVLTAQEGIKRGSQRLAAVQKAFLVLQRDIEQAVDRPIRDSFGDEQPAMAGGDSRLPQLEFTRIGHANPRKEKRSNLIRVGYKIEDDKLVRMVWRTLDRPPESTASEIKLLDHLSNAEFRFIDAHGKSQSQWPPVDPQAGRSPPPLPVAVQLRLELDDWGAIVRLFAINDA